LTARDLSERWQMNKKTVLEIPEEDLPKIRTGPQRGRVYYREVDVQRYEIGLPAIDWHSFGNDIVPTQRQPNLVLLDPNKPTRII